MNMTEQAPEVEGQVADAAPDTQGQANDAVEPSWYDTAPNETKGYIQNKGWDDPMKAVTSYQELEKFRGANEKELIKLPKDMADTDAMGEVYSRLGRPDSAEGYEIEIPEGANIDNNRLEQFKGKAHELGLNNSQFEAVVAGQLEYEQAALQSFQEERLKQETIELDQLKKDWGSNFGEREELAKRFIRKFTPEGVDADKAIEGMQESLGTANLYKFLANAGDALGREHKIHDSIEARPFGYTREQAMSDKSSLKSEIAADPARLQMYSEGKGPDMKKMSDLNKIITGG